jgi:hypothetical protein
MFCSSAGLCCDTASSDFAAGALLSVTNGTCLRILQLLLPIGSKQYAERLLAQSINYGV